MTLQEETDTAYEAYQTLRGIIRSTGMMVAENKCEHPTANRVFLGKVFDTESMVIEIPEGKLWEIKSLLHKFVRK